MKREGRGCPALPSVLPPQSATYLVRRAVRDRDAALRAPVLRAVVLREVPRAVVPLAVVVRAAGFFAAGFAALRTAGFAAAFAAKYGTEMWDYVVRDGAFTDPVLGEGRVIVFRVQPVRGLGFRKGDIFSQTTWIFSRFPAKLLILKIRGEGEGSPRPRFSRIGAQS